jgi:aspartate-semialdehyde dehydrogenase
VSKLLPLASERSKGQKISFNGELVEVEVLTEEAFKGVDFALFSAGGSISEKFVPAAVKHGTICIDNTSHFRMHPDVPLVVPEVNAHALKAHKGIIANPNCSTAQMVLPLKALHDAAGLARVVVSTYQSVSGAGKDAIDELEKHTRLNLNGSQPPAEQFPVSMPFNVIPQIDVFTENVSAFSTHKITPGIKQSRLILSCRKLKRWPVPPKITSWLAT